MITFERHILDNGLCVLLHEDRSTPMVAVNVTYRVGSRNENPNRTGFAHLFEHLMFAGSEHAPSYDDPIQYAGGDSNAYTNPDSTGFYSLVPAQNSDIALFLEADRMQYLSITKKALKVQQQVVAEEFAEVINQPYGDVWHVLAPLIYKDHPYSWPVLGRQVDHITGATLQDVTGFYRKFYGPNNAILSVAGNFRADAMLNKVKHYFGNIPPRDVPALELPNLRLPGSQQVFQHKDDVPVEALFLAFPMGKRTDRDFYAADLLSDILAEGKSSRLQRILYKQRKLCSAIDAYITATFDTGLFIIEARCNDTVPRHQLLNAIWEQLELLKIAPVEPHELTKFQNNLESTFSFSQIHVLQKAASLAYYELIGNADLINEERHAYLSLGANDLMEAAKVLFRKDHSSLLLYDPVSE